MVFSCSIYMCHKIIFGIFEGMKKKEQRTQRTRYELTPPEFVLVRTSSLFFSCSSTYRRFIADSVVSSSPMKSRKTGSNLPSVSRRIDLWNCASIYSSFSWGLHSIVMMSFCICTMIFSIENPNPGNTAPSVSHDPRLAAPIKVCCDRKYYYLNTGHCILYRPRTMYGGGGDTSGKDTV